MKKLTTCRKLPKLPLKGYSIDEYLFFAILLLCIFVHFMGLDSIVKEVNIDESAVGYSAWCLGNYGVDRYTNSWPVYIQNFYAGQSAAYAYLLIPLIKVFGFNIWTIRSLNALFYVLAIFPLYKIAKRTSDNKIGHLIVPFLYTILPIFIMLGRNGFDCNLMLPFLIFFLNQVLKAIGSGKVCDYLLAAVLAGLTLYTYALSYLIIPIFLIALYSVLLKQKKINLKQSGVVIVTLFLMSMPIIIEMAVQEFASGNITIGSITFIKMIQNRQDEISLRYFAKGISIIIFKILTSDFISYWSSTKFLSCYIISIPFFLVGLFSYGKKAWLELKDNHISVYFVVFLFFVTSTFSYSLLQSFSLYRLNALYIPVVFFVAEGIRILVQKTSKRIGKLIFIVYLIFFVMFWNYYSAGDYRADLNKAAGISTEMFSDEIEWINVNLGKRDIKIVAKDPNWLHVIFSLGNVNPYEIKGIDDSSNANIPYKNYDISPQVSYQKSDVYIINNHAIGHEYSMEFVEYIIGQSKYKQVFADYTIFYNKEESKE